MPVLLRLFFIALRLFFVAASAVLLGLFFHDSTSNRIVALVIAIALSISLPIFWFRKKEFSRLETFVPVTSGCALFFGYVGTFIQIDIEKTDWTGTVGPELMVAMPIMFYFIAIVFVIPACVGFVQFRRYESRKNRTSIPGNIST